MSWFESASLKPAGSEPAKSFSAEQAALTQSGAMSPLWLLFVGASTVGIAYWGMTRWMKLATPERMVEPVRLRLVKPEPEAKPEPVPVVELRPAPAPEAKAPEPVAVAPKVIETPAPALPG